MNREFVKTKIQDVARLDGYGTLSKEHLHILEEIYREGTKARMSGRTFEQLPIQTLKDKIFRLGVQYQRMLVRSILREGRSSIGGKCGGEG